MIELSNALWRPAPRIVLTNDKALLRVASYAGISIIKPDEFFRLSNEM
jgi:hypothetical protein